MRTAQLVSEISEVVCNVEKPASDEDRVHVNVQRSVSVCNLAGDTCFECHAVGKEPSSSDIFTCKRSLKR